MGYESKLIVVNKWCSDDRNPFAEPVKESFGETIAVLDLCGMPDSFFPINETFENEIEENRYLFLDGKEVSKDCYGKLVRYTSVEKLLKVLYKCESEEHYRRTEMAINLLKTFTSGDWDNIVVFHFGY